MVLWQRLATCSFAPDWAGNLQSATVFPGILHLQKRCCLLKLRQFWQKGSLQQSHFRGRRHFGFLDSKKWSSPVALKACFKQNPTLIHLRHAKSFVFRAARKVPHCQKMGLPRTTAFRFGKGHSEALFNVYFNSRRDQKRARQIHTLERVATLFLGLRHDARKAPAVSKVHQKQ